MNPHGIEDAKLEIKVRNKTASRKEMDRYRNRLKVLDDKRLANLKQARDTKNLKMIATLWAENQLKPKILSDKQRMAIHYLTDFVQNYSYKWIAMRVGCTTTELNEWRNEPIFLRELDKEITRRRSFIRVHAFRNIHRAIMRGDMKATWNYLKMSGDLKENIEITDNTGEKELDDNELSQQISELTTKLAAANSPSDN